MITAQQLAAIMPNAGPRVGLFLSHLNAAMHEYQITTPARQAAFLAQVAHESGELRYVRELASGFAYEGREDLGNVFKGDGARYKGRGLIQITGRANYYKCSEALFDDWHVLIDDPAALEQPRHACLSAAWFWHSRALNTLADAGEFKAITRKINGGYNGLAERLKYYERAKLALGVTP